MVGIRDKLLLKSIAIVSALLAILGGLALVQYSYVNPLQLVGVSLLNSTLIILVLANVKKVTMFLISVAALLFSEYVYLVFIGQSRIIYVQALLLIAIAFSARSNLLWFDATLE